MVAAGAIVTMDVPDYFLANKVINNKTTTEKSEKKLNQIK